MNNSWKKNFKIVHNFYNIRRVRLKIIFLNISHKIIKRIIIKIEEDIRKYDLK